MLKERVSIPTTDGAEIVMDAYVPDVIESIDPSIRRPAVVLFPGGGYFFCNPREGEPIALRFLMEGFNVFVVWYRVKPEKWPAQLMDAAAAIACVRARAEEWHTHPDQIAVMGFSAGGHLAAAMGTMWHEELWQPLGLAPKDVRPNAMVLSYAVTTGAFGGCKTFQNTTGSMDAEDHNPLYLPEKITANCPPAFIWHTAADDAVSVEHALILARALAFAEVPFEMHVFPHGGHGLGLAKSNPAAAQWTELCKDWLRRLGFAD